MRAAPKRFLPNPRVRNDEYPRTPQSGFEGFPTFEKACGQAPRNRARRHVRRARFFPERKRRKNNSSRQEIARKIQRFSDFCCPLPPSRKIPRFSWWACCRKQFLRHAHIANKARKKRLHSVKKQATKAKRGIRSPDCQKTGPHGKSFSILPELRNHFQRHARFEPVVFPLLP